MSGFKNTHLSYSRLACYERCPAAFKMRYVDKKPSMSGTPLLFGKAIHAVLEDLVLEHVKLGRSGFLSELSVRSLWRDLWTKSDLTGSSIFEEGLQLLLGFIKRQGPLSHHDVLAVEQKFEFKIGDFKVLGFIDRVDRIDHETIEVIDYKTNRQLMSQAEADHSLQMSIYSLAVKELWPWAKNVKLTFDMLRHGAHVSSERTSQQLDATQGYIKTLGYMTEQDEVFSENLNTNCVWCEHRDDCPAYAQALRGERQAICQDLEDLEAVAREREELAQLTKILSARKRELEGVLKTHLETQDDLILGGVRYQMRTSASKTYPLSTTLKLLSKVLGVSPRYILHEIATVDKKALDRIIKDVAESLGKQKTLMLRAELEAIAECRLSQRFSAKAVLK